MFCYPVSEFPVCLTKIQLLAISASNQIDQVACHTMILLFTMYMQVVNMFFDLL